ncbi:2-hydroxyacid dehydrogenase [Ruminococcus sp.]|uniref:2-hydroxyacid dehydrogenase n=1 Tax=Ruminococcus sp. TaxID=41978 RepID=UPI0025F81046|nr:2-hydroxyacid dehydrogenase [Ruminococcus sp.]
MKILFYDAKQYDIDSFEGELKSGGRAYADIRADYIAADLAPETAKLAEGYEAVCAFVSSAITAQVLRRLGELGVRLLLMRCAGYNNVDLAEAKRRNITVMRVPRYSPEAVAEHAMALALAVTRRIHKGYIKVRENNFSLTGLMGVDLHGKTAGIIGTGKIGAAMCKICRGFGMDVIAYDVYENPELDFVSYYPLSEVLKASDLISLHCPLTEESYHLINTQTIELMKDDVIFVNTSRGALVNTEDLIKGIRSRKFHGVGLDVYEEETENVFENRQEDILESSITARLMSFPNVIVTSHQGFFTKEALTAISRTTLENAAAFGRGKIIKENVVE